MKPKAGMALGGRYELKDLIAVGGMGEVWSAYDKALHREVALKVLREEYTGQQEFLRRLRTEARNSAALAHPNIAQMYDYGEEAGTGYLVMELVPGEPLSDLLERQRTIPPKQLLPILAQTARGLHHAHENSVVHRDVKPGNILLEGSPEDANPGVKITDFGVSQAANQAPMTATGMVMGTAQYLSPEQAIGKPATGRSDIYALGVVAYEAVAGKRPFTGKSPVDIAVAHVNSPVPPLPSGTDPALAALIMRMLAKEPSTRPGDAGRLARELDQMAVRYGAPPSAPVVAMSSPEAGLLASSAAPSSDVLAVGVSHEPEPSVAPQPDTATSQPDSAGPLAQGVSAAPAQRPGRRPRQAGHLRAAAAPPIAAEPIPRPALRLRPNLAAAIPKSTMPSAAGTHLPAAEAAAEHGSGQFRVVDPNESQPTPEVADNPPQLPQQPHRASDNKGRRAALAVLIGIFAILGLLLVMQAVRGRPVAPVQTVDAVDVRSLESMSWNSERPSHGG